MPDQLLRILHMASSQRWTGAAEPAAALAAEQIRQGHQVEFACIGGSSFERRLGELGVPFLAGFNFDRKLRPGHLRQDIARLRQFVDARKYDIVHCHLPHDHWTAALALRGPFCRYKRRGPVIIRTMHRDSPPRHDLAHRWLVGKGTDMVIAIAQSQRQALIDVAGLPPSRVRWVRGAVDLARFHPGISGDSIRQLFHIPPEARVAGLVARMQAHRGHYWFLSTLEEVVEAVPMAFYAMAGRGEIKRELIEKIQKHKLAHHLRRIGYRKNDLPETYAAFDVVLLLVPGSDGTCRAMLEAMACGRPVIGARRGAIADAIEPGVNGWLVEPNDERELAIALIEALNNPDRTHQMGEAARRTVEEKYNRPAQCQATTEVYLEALTRRAPAGVPAAS